MDAAPVQIRALAIWVQKCAHNYLKRQLVCRFIFYLENCILKSTKNVNKYQGSVYTRKN